MRKPASGPLISGSVVMHSTCCGTDHSYKKSFIYTCKNRSHFIFFTTFQLYSFRFFVYLFRAALCRLLLQPSSVLFHWRNSLILGIFQPYGTPSGRLQPYPRTRSKENTLACFSRSAVTNFSRRKPGRRANPATNGRPPAEKAETEIGFENGTAY